MPEELQGILDKIKKDGIDKAQAEAERILAQAREQATAVLKKAEDQAGAMSRKAETDARKTAEQGRRTLEQAARDVILSIGQALDRTLREVIQRRVSQTMAGDLLSQMLVKAVQSYCGQSGGDSRIEVILSPDDREKMAAALLQQLGSDMAQGLDIRSDASVVRGFRVSLKDQNVEHDFTQEAIVDALCQIVRPHLADIVRSAAASQ